VLPALATTVVALLLVAFALLLAVATGLAVIAVGAHTAYLVTRWIAAGRIEILLRERTGDVLTGSERFWYLISHPPYTNLFDALNFVAWAMMVCYLIIERKWGLRVVGVLAIAIAGVLGLFVARWLTRPLASLARGARALAAGDTAVPLPRAGPGEVTSLQK